jgi:phosphatidate cytidylyltransferase
LKRVLTALVLVPLVLGLLLVAPHWLFAAAIGVVAVLAADEFLLLAKGYGLKPFRKTVLLFIALYFAGIALKDYSGKIAGFSDSDVFMFSVVVRVFPLLLLAMAMARENLRTSFLSAAFSYLAIPYIALTLGELVNTRRLPAGIVWLLFFLVLIWSGDILAYYIGRAFGRHPLAPRISPKKTWEGTVASFLGAIGIGFLLFEYIDPITNGLVHFMFQFEILHPRTVLQESVHLQTPALWHILLFSALINIAAQLGDLVESMVKRGADVKDSGSLLPGHGGLLDRIDALLLAAPVLWYYASNVKLTS